MKFQKLLIVAAALTLLLTACSAPAADPSDGGEATTTTAAVTTASTEIVTVAPTEAVTETTAPPVKDTPLVKTFEAGEHRFTLTLPASWDGAYAVRESENSVAFYELQNHQFNSQGKLFTVLFVAENEYESGMFPSYAELGTDKECRAVALFPTDVQYEPALADAYTALYEDAESVLSTIEFLDDANVG